MNRMRRPSRLGLTWLPLLLIGALVLILPLAALFELPLERQVKNLMGFKYDPPGYCSPVHNRGTFGQWRREGRLPTLLEEARAVHYGDSIYVIGGVVTRVIDNVGRSTSAFRRYDPGSGSFTSLPRVPRRLNHVGAAAHRGSIYVVGGLGDRLEYLSIASNQLLRYDIARRRWQELPPIPTARGALGTAIVGDTFYAVGGRHGANSLNTVEAYDISRSAWSSRAPLPGPGRDHLGVAALDGFVYAVGGRYDGGTELDEFLRYDPRRDSWTEMPPLPAGTSGANLDRVGDELVVTGGEGADQEFVTGRTFAFSPRAGRWRVLAPSPRPKHGHASTSHRGRLYVLGGSRCAGSTPVSTMESLRVEGQRP